MSKRRSIFGPSKDEIWKQIATNIDGEFIDNLLPPLGTRFYPY
ncbi:MAG: hypothetical protein OXU36_24225 [Candidatus Poribacteria bacterium]|nr:hypothetical protein [Candidatus Poribacteria bacterium]